MKTTTTQVQRSKAWHITLWIVQILLAGMFLMAGVMKTFTPIEELSLTLPYAKDMVFLTRFIGLTELAAGIGLIVPAALRIQPQLTWLAAAGLALIMLLALVFHLFRGEISAIGTNVVLGILAIFVAWGRTAKAPIVAKA